MKRNEKTRKKSNADIVFIFLLGKLSYSYQKMIFLSSMGIIEVYLKRFGTVTSWMPTGLLIHIILLYIIEVLITDKPHWDSRESN